MTEEIDYRKVLENYVVFHNATFSSMPKCKLEHIETHEGAGYVSLTIDTEDNTSIRKIRNDWDERTMPKRHRKGCNNAYENLFRIVMTLGTKLMNMPNARNM
jgi:hypothetical protein